MDYAAGMRDVGGCEGGGTQGGRGGVGRFGVAALHHLSWAAGRRRFWLFVLFLIGLFCCGRGRFVNGGFGGAVGLGFGWGVVWLDLICRMRFWLRLRQCACDDVCEPVTYATWSCIDGSMRAVYADAFEGEAEERLLLSVGQSQSFEAFEYYGIYACVFLEFMSRNPS